MVWGRKKSQPAADTPRWNQDDYHKEFAGKLKEQIERGVAPWQKPWKPGESRLPKNIQTDKAYRGGNSVYLSVTQTAKGYSDHRWATYKQISEMGGQVRKGEKATHVLFYKFDDEKKKAQEQPGTPTTEGKAEKEQTRPPMVRCYAVFNVEQADGLKLDRKPGDEIKEPEWKAHQTAERVIQESGVHVAHVRGDRACYNVQTDKVTLPEREQFATANGYYQTALHELGHATGHPSRMDRDTLKNGVGNFGSVEYAREELRAEMSAMMTGERVGVGHDGSRGAAYVDGWIKALDQDPKEMYKAAADAQKISDYLIRPIKEREQTTEQEHARSPRSIPRRTARRSATRPRSSPRRKPARPASAARPCSTVPTFSGERNRRPRRPTRRHGATTRCARSTTNQTRQVNGRPTRPTTATRTAHRASRPTNTVPRASTATTPRAQNWRPNDTTANDWTASPRRARGPTPPPTSRATPPPGPTDRPARYGPRTRKATP